jgi:hypothetical protein
MVWHISQFDRNVYPTDTDSLYHLITLQRCLLARPRNMIVQSHSLIQSPFMVIHSITIVMGPRTPKASLEYARFFL